MRRRWAIPPFVLLRGGLSIIGGGAAAFLIGGPSVTLNVLCSCMLGVAAIDLIRIAATLYDDHRSMPAVMKGRRF